MRIVLPAVAHPAHLCGVARHSVNVVRSLLTLPEITELHLVLGVWQQKSFSAMLPTGDERLRLHIAPVHRSTFGRNLWYYRKLPALVKALRPDLVHLTYPVPVRARDFACPAVVSLHDMYPYELPSNFGFPKGIFNRASLQICLRAVDAIACVSQTTHRQLARYASAACLRKSSVIPNCLEPVAPSSAPPNLPGWKGEPFLLLVAQHRRNKNILLALRVFARVLAEGSIDPRSRLVIIGIEGPETAAIRRYIFLAGISERVLLLEGVSDPDLQWCYRHCTLLLAPSLLEGFGLPVAEALLNGCPVVCSDIPPFRELGSQLGKDRCRYVSLEGEAELGFAAAIAEAQLAPSSANAQPSASETGLARLSAPVVGQAYLQMYRGLLNRHVRSAVASAGRYGSSFPAKTLQKEGRP